MLFQLPIQIVVSCSTLTLAMWWCKQLPTTLPSAFQSGYMFTLVFIMRICFGDEIWWLIPHTDFLQQASEKTQQQGIWCMEHKCAYMSVRVSVWFWLVANAQKKGLGELAQSSILITECCSHSHYLTSSRCCRYESSSILWLFVFTESSATDTILSEVLEVVTPRWKNTARLVKLRSWGLLFSFLTETV